MATEQSTAPTVPTSDDARASSIAELLLGEDESNDVSEGEETLTQETTNEVEESNEVETDEVETTSDDDDSEEEEAPIAASDDDEDVTWEKVLGVKEGQLNFDEEGNLVGFNTKVNGESATVKAEELIAGFQNNKAATQKSQALAEEKKAFDTEVGELRKQYAEKLHTVDSLNKYFENQLLQEYQGINWEQLRIENPAEYAATRQDYTQRALEFQQINEAIKVDMAKAQEEMQGKVQQTMSQRNAEQRAKMVEVNPTWADDKTFQKEITSIKDFVSDTYGFSEGEFVNAFDARMISLVQDAQKFREGKKLVDSSPKRKVPQFQKSSGRKPSKKVTKLEKLTKASKQAKGSSKRNLQADAVAELLLGG